MGQDSEATEIFQQAIRLSPQRVDLRLSLGNLQVSQSNYVAAVECYRRALKIDPANAGVHFNLCLVEGMQGQTEAERRELAEALRLKPDFYAAQEQLDRVNACLTN